MPTRTNKRTRKWIAKAISPKSKGALHRALGVPQDEKIPPSKLRQAAAQSGVTGKRARLAITLSKLHHHGSAR